ncbi:hypothetical protein D3C86_1948040 [compost metagenome]
MSSMIVLNFSYSSCHCLALKKKSTLGFIVFVGVLGLCRVFKIPDQASGISGSTNFINFSNDSCHPK